jgi:plasmid maintenance system killer protein
VEYHFTNKHLEQLYTEGFSRKYKLPENVVYEFVGVIQEIAAAVDINDFWKLPALKFEKMRGYTSRYSFRVTRKYRLEADIEWENDQHTVGIVGIDKLSSHYQ